MRLLVRAVALVALLLLLAVAATVAAVWRTLPGGDLRASIPRLSAAVSIDLDRDGIPRIRAASETDAAAALGFLHARDRMFQMDLMRRNASGRLSELAGTATLRQDRFMRTLGLRRAAEVEFARLPTDVRTILEAYARGVNAWIARRGRFAALEFVPFGAPAPWTPVDSLLWGKTMALYLSDNLRVELARLSLEGRMPLATIYRLWPASSAAGHPEAMAIPDTRLSATASRLAAAIPAFPAPFTLPDEASNGWAVDGRHSATGAPLLAGDPHLGFSLPGIWYLARIEWPGQVRVGATAPGVPMLVLGHNGHVAWTFTTTGADTQDLFVERPSDATHYAAPEGPLPYIVRKERIRVAGAADETLTVRETRHGPVISDLIDPNGPVLALSDASLQPGDTAAAGLVALNRAPDVGAAAAAAAAITAPVQNLIVADRTRIALFVTGRVPIRKSGDGSIPQPGADGAHDWTGFATGDALPRIVAPESGRLVNANDRVAPPDFPVLIARDWYADFRARRIRALLDTPGAITAARFARMQVDAVDVFAQQVLPRLRALPFQTGIEAAAQRLLAAWDGRAGIDLPQPLIFNDWMRRFAARLLRGRGVPEGDSAAAAPWPDIVAAALGPDEAFWCGTSCQPSLLASRADSLAALSASYGADPVAWRWGQAHPALFEHPILRAVPLLGRLVEGRIAAPGDETTVDRGGMRESGSLAAVHGASFRGVYDLADLDRSLFALAPGQAGNPISPRARNFLRRWRDGIPVMLGADFGPPASHIDLVPAGDTR
jgi:penicillin amidase